MTWDSWRAAARRRIRRGDLRRLGDLPDALPEGVRCVSLDCFDTLVHRRIDPPEQVLTEICRRWSRVLAAAGTSCSTEALAQAREEIAVALRSARVTGGGDPEYRLSDLCTALSARFAGGDPAMAQHLQRIEWSTECEVLYAHPDAAGMLHRLSDRGLRIIITSDMYWSGTEVRDMLARAGLGGVLLTVLTSGDEGVSKHRGRLYDRLLETAGVPALEIIHAGDNLHADGDMPRTRGIRALWLKDTADLARRRSLRRQLVLPHGVRLRAAAVRAPEGVDAAQRIGTQVLGPALVPYVAEVLDRVAASPCGPGQRRIVGFMARDGWLLQRIAELLIQATPDRWPGLDRRSFRYLCLSRLSTIPAGVEDTDAEVRRLVHAQAPQGSPSSIARLLGVPEERILHAAADLKLDPDQRLDPEDAAPALALVAHPVIASDLREWRDAHREALLGYLEAEDAFGKDTDLHLVDLGWLGSIQRAMTRALRNHPGRPRMTGHLLGNLAAPGPVEGVEDSRLAPGFLVPGCPSRWTAGVTRGISLLEIACNGDHGSTIGYAREGDAWKPVFGPAATSHPAVERIRTGVLAWADWFITEPAVHGTPHTGWSAYAAERLNRFVRRPSAEEAALLSGVDFDLDYGIGRSLPLVRPGLPASMLVRPRALLSAIRGVAWVEGTLRLSSIPCPFLLHDAWLALRRLRGGA
jgi:FMN phosphatase YigB (HAD superfamily)